MNKTELIKLYKQEATIDYSCDINDFNKTKNVFISDETKIFKIVTFGINAVIVGNDNMIKFCIDHFENTEADRIMDGDNIFLIEKELRKYNLKLQGEHIRYMYIGNKIIEKPKGYTFRLFTKDDMKKLHNFRSFDMALGYSDFDVIGYGAFYNDTLIALAGADNNNDNIWQIGIDTFTEHKNKGLGAYLVKTLADEIGKLGKLVCYTTWGANIASTTLAINVGFMPVMTFYYAK